MARVEDILMVKGPDVIVSCSTDTVLDASRKMAEANVGSVVVREGDDLKGIFTERDLLRRVVARAKDPAATTLSEVMSSPVRCCSLGDDVNKLAESLRREHIRHLVVVEDGALVGMIGLRDVMAAQLRERRQRIRDLEECAREAN